MTGRRRLWIAAILLLFVSARSSAEQLLMTLQVDSSRVQWQEEFLLRLEIYGPPSGSPPTVTIDGLDQFQLRAQGRNLLQVPGGTTVKWILTYTLLASQDGTFKIGPARAAQEGRTYTSNTIFITVEGTPQTHPPKDVVQTPLVHSAQEVQDRVLLLMDAANSRPFRGEGFTVTLRLLSQIPVENLRFIDEAEFPGFLKYDFPYTDRPQAQHITYRGQDYASFDLQKFLVFPIHPGELALPPYRCEVSVRVPSGSFPAADLALKVERASNALSIHALELPAPADLIGSFHLTRSLVSDESRSKTVRMILEGNGLLSTFNFPDVTFDSGNEARVLSTETQATLEHGRLRSRKTLEMEISPASDTTELVLPAIRVQQFDPGSKSFSSLVAPPLTLSFRPPPQALPARIPLPQAAAAWPLLAWPAAVLSLLALAVLTKRPGRKKKAPGLDSLLRHKKPHLQIPKTTAQALYQRIAQLISLRDSEGESLTETLRLHLPEEDWEKMEDVLLRLELTAFSQIRNNGLTYGELKESLHSIEKRWLA